MAGLPPRSERGISPRPVETVPTRELTPQRLLLVAGGNPLTPDAISYKYELDGTALVNFRELTITITEEHHKPRTLPLVDTMTTLRETGEVGAKIVFPMRSVEIVDGEAFSAGHLYFIPDGYSMGIFVISLQNGEYDCHFYPYEEEWPEDVEEAAIVASELRDESGELRVFEF